MEFIYGYLAFAVGISLGVFKTATTGSEKGFFENFVDVKNKLEIEEDVGMLKFIFITIFFVIISPILIFF